MAQTTEFEHRVARIRSRPPEPSPQRDVPEGLALRPAPATTPRPAILDVMPGLALIAGGVGDARNHIAILLPKYEEGRKVTFLAPALRNRMSDERIKRMNGNPGFEGMSRMQKMIPDH